MAVYCVHLRGEDPAGIAEAVFTREGFDRDAFLFGPFWLARHRLWTAVAVWAAVFFALVIAASLGVLSSSATLAIALLLETLLGFEAHRLLETELDSRGYYLVEMIAAPARDQAEAEFYRRFEAPREPAPAAAPSPGRRIAGRQDVLGHFPDPGGRR